MAKIILDSPMTLNPAQATELRYAFAMIDDAAETVTVHYDMATVAGALERRSVILDSAAVKTWVQNQRTTILNQIKSKLGVTGTNQI